MDQDAFLVTGMRLVLSLQAEKAEFDRKKASEPKLHVPRH